MRSRNLSRLAAMAVSGTLFASGSYAWEVVNTGACTQGKRQCELQVKHNPQIGDARQKAKAACKAENDKYKRVILRGAGPADQTSTGEPSSMLVMTVVCLLK